MATLSWVWDFFWVLFVGRLSDDEIIIILEDCIFAKLRCMPCIFMKARCTTTSLLKTIEGCIYLTASKKEIFVLHALPIWPLHKVSAAALWNSDNRMRSLQCRKPTEHKCEETQVCKAHGAGGVYCWRYYYPADIRPICFCRSYYTWGYKRQWAVLMGGLMSRFKDTPRTLKLQNHRYISFKLIWK